MIERVINRYSLGKEPSDRSYWLSVSPTERIAQVERIRAEFHGWTDETQPRLQRVCRVTQLK